MIALLLVATVATLPADVRAFRAQHQSCEHWLGEEAYDAPRGRQIAAAVRRDCTGIDRVRARLLRRYHARPAARRFIARFPLLEG